MELADDVRRRAHEPDFAVETQWRFGRGDAVAFGVLTLLQIGTCAWAFRRLSHGGVVFGATTLVLLVPFVIALLLVGSRWLALPLMQVCPCTCPRGQGGAWRW